MNNKLNRALDRLSHEFHTLDWTYHDYPAGGAGEKIFYWPGKPEEDIMICALKSRRIDELFHRQDFFFFNFAYSNSYDALSAKSDNLITVQENECYIGQPFSGYALRGESQKDIIILGVLIQKDTFFREYLPTIAKDSSMFNFFLAPQKDIFSDEFIHLKFDRQSPVRPLLEMMVTEYADRKEDTQSILKPMVLTLFMQIARVYREQDRNAPPDTLSERIIRYMGENSEKATLKDIAAHFSYHPNYISSLLHRELGKTFSEILLDKRMERASALLSGTNLSIAEIAAMLGYSNSSNFYKAYREYFGRSPRGSNEYAGRQRRGAPQEKSGLI